MFSKYTDYINHNNKDYQAELSVDGALHDQNGLETLVLSA